MNIKFQSIHDEEFYLKNFEAGLKPAFFIYPWVKLFKQLLLDVA